MSKFTAEAARLFRSNVKAWPHDPVRPGLQFSQAMRTRLAVLEQVAEREDASHTMEKSIRQEALALRELLDDRFAKKYRLSNRIMKPHLDPYHFEKIKQDLEQVPTRSWLQSKLVWLKGKVRWG